MQNENGLPFKFDDQYENPVTHVRNQNPFASKNANPVQPRVMQSLLLGFCIGFLIAAATVAYIRLSHDPVDFEASVLRGLIVLVPALIALAAVWFVQRRNPITTSGSRPFHKPALCAMLFAGLAGGSSLLAFPTQGRIMNDLMQQHRELFQTRVNQLAKCRSMIDDYQPGSLSKRITAAQLDTLAMTPINPDFSRYDLSTDWNTLISPIEDFARVKEDTPPGSIDAGYELTSRKIELPYWFDTYGPRVDQYAMAAFNEMDFSSYKGTPTEYSTGLYEPQDIVELARELEQLRYLLVIRMTGRHEPHVSSLASGAPDRNDSDSEQGEEPMGVFNAGYACGEVFCFDIHETKLIAAFPFESTSSENIGYSYREGENEESSAEASLRKDLDDNQWTAFWHELHKLAGKIPGAGEDTELPYKPESLPLARSRWIKEKSISFDAGDGAHNASTNLQGGLNDLFGSSTNEK